MEKKLRTRRENGKSGFVDMEGKWIIPPIFDSARNFREGTACVSIDGLYGHLLEDGSYLIPPIYEYSESFWTGVAAVTVNGKVGFINKEGIFVIPPIFDRAANFFHREFTYVVLNGKSGWMNLDGSYLVEPIYEDTFHHVRWIEVMLDGKCGALYPSGEEIVPCRFDCIREVDGSLYLLAGGVWYVKKF